KRRSDLATNIGTTAQDAGSRGALAATLLADPGLGELDANLASGQNFFTDESLMPLGHLLGQREEASKAPNFLTFNPIQAQQVAVPQFNPANFLNGGVSQTGQSGGMMNEAADDGMGTLTALDRNAGTSLTMYDADTWANKKDP